jgi:hypothetical protein
MLKLTFVRDRTTSQASPTTQWGWPGPAFIEGRDATEIIERWRASFAISYDAATFRQCLLDFSGGNDPRYVRHPTRLPAIDDALRRVALTCPLLANRDWSGIGERRFRKGEPRVESVRNSRAALDLTIGRWLAPNL